MSERVAELKTAFHWWCDDCGEPNFALPRKAELTDKHAEEAYRKYHLLDDWAELPENWREFEIVQIPATVTCKNCGEVFRAIEEQPQD